MKNKYLTRCLCITLISTMVMAGSFSAMASDEADLTASEVASAEVKAVDTTTAAAQSEVVPVAETSAESPVSIRNRDRQAAAMNLAAADRKQIRSLPIISRMKTAVHHQKRIILLILRNRLHQDHQRHRRHQRVLSHQKHRHRQRRRNQQRHPMEN